MKDQDMNAVCPNGLGIEIKTKFPPLGAPGRISTLAQVMRYDPDSYVVMLQYIKQGAYPWVVFESLGVCARTYYIWIRKGRTEIEELLQKYEDDKSPKRKPAEVSVYGQLFLDVMKAQGQARLSCELAVKRRSPERWLTGGPGRSREDQPGWSPETQNINLNAQLEADVTIEDYTRAPTDAETLRLALVNLQKYLVGGLPGLLEYTENQVKKKTVDSNFSPEDNGQSDNGESNGSKK